MWQKNGNMIWKEEGRHKTANLSIELKPHMCLLQALEDTW